MVTRFEILPNQLDRKVLSSMWLHIPTVRQNRFQIEEDTKEKSSEKFSLGSHEGSLPGALRAAPRRPAASGACTSWNGGARSSISAACQLCRSPAGSRSSQLSALSITASPALSITAPPQSLQLALGQTGTTQHMHGEQRLMSGAAPCNSMWALRASLPASHASLQAQ